MHETPTWFKLLFALALIVWAAFVVLIGVALVCLIRWLW